jgi:hypothetical protein
MAIRIVKNQAGIDEIQRRMGDLLDQFAQNIIDVAIPPVDTGFLQASAYVKSERVNTFDLIWSDGMYFSPAFGHDMLRESAGGPMQESGWDETIAGWGADYAADIEVNNTAFIYQALMNAIT